jgi:serine/threonine-protein kinase
MKNAIGTHLGRYELDAEIGRGAMGLVYQAHDPKIDRVVAIKTISLFSQEIEDEKEFRERFFLEAKAAGRLSHPGIVTIFDVGEEPETHEPYIVMEFVSGQPLNKILAVNNRKLALGPALQITQEIAEALNYAHSQGVVHRDVKPANILITMEGHVKIADFGIAKLNQGLMTIPGQVLGSPAYMAPEQLSGEYADARSDLFSLGVILYSMLTGFRPFQGNSAATVSYKVVNRDPLPVTSFDSEFPAELDRLVSRAIAKDPEQRYQSGAEMAQEIQRLRERHELMNQTAAALTTITDPLDGTGVVKAPAPRAAVTPRTQTSSTIRIERARAETTPSRTTGTAQPQVPEASKTENAVKPRTPMAMPAWVPELKSKLLSAKLPVMPKEIAIAAASILTLAIVFIGFEAIHSKKAKAQIASTAISSVQTATLNQSSNVAPPNAEPTNDTPVEEVKETEVHKAPRHPKTKTESKPKTTLAANTPITNSSPSPAPALIPATGSGKTPASVQNVKATIAPAPATATLELQIEYQFSEAEASVWFDNQLIYSQKLYGESKKRALVFKKVEGREHSTVKVPAGEHRIHVRIQSEGEQYDQSQTITGTFAASSQSTLAITCDKRGHDHELQLALQ